MKLDSNGQFVTLDGKKLGVVATKKGKRWQFRSFESGTLYASGMTPKEFAKGFWYRDDFQEVEG